ncbi:hypothetical protein D777_03079 [Marinobacter nitratireducens]|uniref:Calcineurin-like phosphoesterase domain-containing protein n=1 Tax=Marinobacter nitratireducens TaxID=1137280 RepID=A0A072MYU4_9GAMM|nr:hypothetical protein [Marinobacter nitratireducens]KEF29903.1 hypothetical protein D777_03079 [Marinobacter nitratireducens]
MTEGRSCPLAYRYEPASLCKNPEPVTEDVLYIVGGLYGNPLALDEIERMAVAEEQAGRRVRLVFNGDFNWFNASDELFRDINDRVLAHTASLGNVEYELADASDGAGCGCAYPEFVDQAVVERSNRIMERLQSTANQYPDIQERLAALPRYRCLMFGGLKILVLHGDPESLAGWGLAHESFSTGNDSDVRRWLAATGADVIACTHTCLPVLWATATETPSGVVVNNGSAGMGNLKGDRRGLITRIAAGPSPEVAVARQEVSGLAVSLVPVAFDGAAWLACFDQLWPAGSDASESYRHRIISGTALAPEQVMFPSKNS